MAVGRRRNNLANARDRMHDPLAASGDSPTMLVAPAFTAKAGLTLVDELQVIAKARKNFLERTALHLVDFEPVVFVNVAFQDDF